MVLNSNKEVKLYYSIKEVAAMFGLNESTLRFWEKEFPQLKPKTVSSTKVRQYTKADIECIKKINSLLRVRGFRIAAAKKMLAQNPDGVDRNAEILEKLIQVRDELKALKKQLGDME